MIFFIGLINLGSIFNPTKLTKHIFNFENMIKLSSFLFIYLFIFLENKLLKTEGKNGYQTCSILFFFFSYKYCLSIFFNVNQNYLLLF